MQDATPPIGFLLVRLGEQIDQGFVDALATLGLKPRDLRLLIVVERAGRLSQRRLAAELGVDPGNLIAALDRLEEAGVLVRERDPADRRQRLVALTPAGTRLLRRAVKAAAAVEDEVLAAISDDERRLLHRLAHRIWMERSSRVARDRR